MVAGAILLKCQFKVLIKADKAPYGLCLPVPLSLSLLAIHPFPLVFGQFLEHFKCQAVSRLGNVFPISSA